MKLIEGYYLERRDTYEKGSKEAGNNKRGMHNCYGTAYSWNICVQVGQAGISGNKEDKG